MPGRILISIAAPAVEQMGPRIKNGLYHPIAATNPPAKIELMAVLIESANCLMPDPSALSPSRDWNLPYYQLRIYQRTPRDSNRSCQWDE